MQLAKITLPHYTKGEEIFNSISHGMGIILGIISCVLCLIKADSTNARLGAIVFSVSVMVSLWRLFQSPLLSCSGMC